MSFWDADYAAIEARITPWLAGQEDALEEYRKQDNAKTKEEKFIRCRYRIQAAEIYRIPVLQVTNHPHRFVGKFTILGCGFGMGPAKFRESVRRFGYELPPGLETVAVKAWRAKHKKVVAFWYDLERAAKSAISYPGKIFKAGKFIQFLVKDVAGMPFLLMRLPSGRKLSYPKPRISGDRITFLGNYKGVNWGDVTTWGGSLCENGVQAVAADIMANGVHNTEREGYETATLIHDQCLAYYHPERGQTAERFVELLTDLPPWAAGLPIAAEGGLVPFYRKD